MTYWMRKHQNSSEFVMVVNIGDIVFEKVNWVTTTKIPLSGAFLDENDDRIDVVNEMIEDATLEADGKIKDLFVKALFVNNATWSEMEVKLALHHLMRNPTIYAGTFSLYRGRLQI
ncbi:MAG: hypothetical protein ACLRSD_00010 [Oscillibacter sp.]